MAVESITDILTTQSSVYATYYADPYSRAANSVMETLAISEKLSNNISNQTANLDTGNQDELEQLPSANALVVDAVSNQVESNYYYSFQVSLNTPLQNQVNPFDSFAQSDSAKQEAENLLKGNSSGSANANSILEDYRYIPPAERLRDVEYQLDQKVAENIGLTRPSATDLYKIDPYNYPPKESVLQSIIGNPAKEFIAYTREGNPDDKDSKKSNPFSVEAILDRPTQSPFERAVGESVGVNEGKNSDSTFAYETVTSALAAFDHKEENQNPLLTDSIRALAEDPTHRNVEFTSGASVAFSTSFSVGNLKGAA